MIRRRHATLAALAAMVPAAARAQAAWPTKPIRLIVPYGPGGSADQVARLYAERLSSVLGQQIIVENKHGASGGEHGEPALRNIGKADELISLAAHALDRAHRIFEAPILLSGG